MTLSHTKRAVVALTAILLAACAAVPDDGRGVQPLAPASVQLPADLRHALEGDWPADAWWRGYGDPQLDELVALALQGSPSLQAAGSRVSSAQAALAVTRAASDLSVDLNAGAVRTLYSSNGLFPPPIGGTAFTEYTTQVNARKEIDLWGRTHALVAAAAGEQAARQAERAQIGQSLAVAVAQGYFEWQADQAMAANLRQQADLQQDLVDDKLRRQARGLVAADDARLEQARLAGLQAQLADIEGHALAEREALRALLPPDAAAAGVHPVDRLKAKPLPTNPVGVPSSLGFELLARRADLQAARWRVEAAMSRVESAQASFYPQLNLGLSLGLDSISLEHLFEAGSETYALGPTLSLPLFNGGRLRGQLEAARSARDELIASYNQQVLDAAREVAQSAAQLRALDQQQARQAVATQQDEAVHASAEARLRQGLADRAAVWRVALAVQQDRQAGLRLMRQRLAAGLGLTRALGGGYRTAEATPPASPTN